MNFEKICYGCFIEREGDVCRVCGFCNDTYQAPVMALPLGTILDGRYITGRVLGVGGFGITYLGFDMRLNVKVAIKEYMPSGVAVRSGDSYTMTVVSKKQEQAYQSGADKFLEEARILAQLRENPNVVSVQNYFRENQTAYFTMDYIEGMSLQELLQDNNGRISYDKAKALLLPVMKALILVHSKGLLHRDISPDNIYITESGNSKLLDFGAARSTQMNKSMSVVLKNGFAPHEQYATDIKQGPWTDVYAMGATLYYCTTGQMPPDSIARIYTDNLIPPTELGASLSTNAQEAIQKALAVRPEDRFQSMTEFIGALENATTNYEGNKIEPSVKLNKTIGISKTPSISSIPSPPSPPNKIEFIEKLKSNKVWLAGAGLLAAVIVALAIIVPMTLIRPTVTQPGGNFDSIGGVVQAPTITTVPSSLPDSFSGTITLPSIEQFLGTAVTQTQRGEQDVYMFPADYMDLQNYVMLLQSDDSYSFVTEGESHEGESFLFRVVQGQAAVDISIEDETGLVVVACIDESSFGQIDAPVTADYLNYNGLTATKWLELDSRYSPNGENYMGSAVCNFRCYTTAVMRGDIVYYTDMSSGYIYALSLADGSKTQLSAEKEYGYGLNITGNTLIYFRYGDGQFSVCRLDVTATKSQPELVRQDAKFPMVMGEWLYFVDAKSSALYRMHTDGTGGEQLITGDGYMENYVVADDCIVYVGTDGSVYSIMPDGSGKKLLLKTSADNLLRWGDWVYYYDTNTEEYMRYSISREEINEVMNPQDTMENGSFYGTIVSGALYGVPEGGSSLYKLYGAGETQEICDYAFYPFTLQYYGESMLAFVNQKDDATYMYDPANDETYMLDQDQVQAVRGNSTGNIVNLGRAVSDGRNLIVFDDMTLQFANIYQGYLYYVDATDDGRLYRMSLADDTKQRIIDAKDIAYVNVVDDQIFYRSTQDKYSVHRCSLDGSNDVKLASMRASRLAAVDGFLYFANWDSGTEGLWRMDYNGDDLQQLYAAGDVPLFINVDGDTVYWASYEQKSCLARTSLTTGVTEFATNVTGAESLNVYNGRIYFFWSDNDQQGIYSITTDFSDLRLVYAGNKISNINIVNDTIYFRVNGGDAPSSGTLLKCSLDGSAVK